MMTIDNQSYHMISHDTKWYPTTSTTPSTTTSTTTATAAAATTNTSGGGDGPEHNVTVMGGELGKGVVFLSDVQIGDLLDRMDLDAFNHYVDKLSNFIIKNDAHVKNHYETILKWWQEDGLIRK
jgi:hypothetical protein